MMKSELFEVRLQEAKGFADTFKKVFILIYPESQDFYYLASNNEGVLLDLAQNYGIVNYQLFRRSLDAY